MTQPPAGFDEDDRQIMELLSQANYYVKQGKSEVSAAYSSLAIATMMWQDCKKNKVKEVTVKELTAQRLDVVDRVCAVNVQKTRLNSRED